MGILKKAERFVSSVIPHAHSAEKRAAMNAAQEQINFYKEEKLANETARKSSADQEAAARKSINEKEIRARQRTQRRGGFMEAPNTQAVDKLG
jgi:hypothetical protein